MKCGLFEHRYAVGKEVAKKTKTCEKESKRLVPTVFAVAFDFTGSLCPNSPKPYEALKM